MHKKCDVAFKLGGSELEKVAEYKYLGIPMGRGMHVGSRPAPFSGYFGRISTKARARSMVVHFLGARRDGMRPKTGLKLYNALVRPILEYGSQVLVYGKAQMKQLEKLQLQIVNEKSR